MLSGISKFEKSLVALSMLVGVIHVLSFGFCLQDDAYIGLRYSRNLAQGHGLVFNPGEHVEGYTNFSWVVLSAIPFLFDADAVVFIRIMSVISVAIAILMVGTLASVLSRRRRGAAFSASFLFASLPFAMGEAAMGLETLFFTAVIVAALSRYFLEREDSAKSGYGSGLLLALGALTRPEAFGVAALFAIADVLRLRKHSNNFELKRQAKTRWIMFALPVLLHISFRLIYYRDIVPNTFHAKVGGGINAINRGIQYIGEFIKDAAPLLIALILSFLVAKKRKLLDYNFEMVLCCTLIASNIVYIMYVGGDFKPSNRFFVLMSAIIAAITGSIIQPFAQQKGRRLLFWLSLIGIVLIVSTGNYYTGDTVRKFTGRRADVLPFHIAAGRWLYSSFPLDTWIATGNAGVLPFESELLTIDMHGLCDKTIASRPMPGMGLATPGHEKGDGLYVLSRHPDIILFMRSRFSAEPLTTNDIELKLFGVSELELWTNPYFHENYTLVSVPIEDFYFNYYQRKPA